MALSKFFLNCTLYKYSCPEAATESLSETLWGRKLPSNIIQGQSINIKSFYKLYGDGAGNYLNID